LAGATSRRILMSAMMRDRGVENCVVAASALREAPDDHA